MIKNQSLTEANPGLIDCAIVASARRNRCRIWTFDKKLRGLLRGADDFLMQYYHFFAAFLEYQTAPSTCSETIFSFSRLLSS
jgi:hypothetical protein